MSEIETREGVEIDALETVARVAWDAWYGHGTSWDDWAKYVTENPGKFDGRDRARDVARAALAARTPAQTQTFKDGFAAGLDAAAKEVDEEHQQHAFTMVGWVLHRLAKSIRALKEPS